MNNQEVELPDEESLDYVKAKVNNWLSNLRGTLAYEEENPPAGRSEDRIRSLKARVDNLTEVAQMLDKVNYIGKKPPKTSFTLAELSEENRQKAIEAMAALLSGDWWDQGDNDDIGDTITYVFAEHLKTPGWDTFGVGDFPGIEGVKLAEWDLDRAQMVKFTGQLNRDNAPALPWVETIESVSLNDRESIYAVQVNENYDVEAELTDADIDAVVEAVEAAINEARSAGNKEIGYKQSKEYAKDYIEGTGQEFTEDGDLI